MRTVHVPVLLPEWIYQPLRGLKRALRPSNGRKINLLGDRDVEWSFVAAHLPPGPGHAFDFGSGPSYVSLVAAQRGFQVVALDLERRAFPWSHPQVQFVWGDLLELELPANHFDVVINCSTVEHVGLAGRFGISDPRPEGDLESMARLFDLLKPGGIMLLTIPCGRDAVFAPLHRVYGVNRLPRLVQGYEMVRSSFWIKEEENRWIPSNRQTALGYEAYADLANPSNCTYALGCFVLHKVAPAPAKTQS